MPGRFPPEIIALVCARTPVGDLPRIMLVDAVCHYFAEQLLYSSIYLDFFDTRKSSRSAKCLQTLSTSTSAAAAVRELTARGLGLVDQSIHADLITALTHASNISTLDIVFNITPDPSFFPESLTLSTAFLPKLSALNVDNPGIALQLVPGRPLHNVRIQETIHDDIYMGVVAALSQSVVAINQLQLKLATLTEDGIFSSFHPIADSFHSLVCLGIQFVLPSPSLGWDSLLKQLCNVASELSSVHSLRVVSLVTLPSPPLPASQIDALAREAAEMIIHDHLPHLHRIEIEWHGWEIPPGAVGNWVSMSRNELLRTNWHFHKSVVRSQGLMDPSG